MLKIRGVAKLGVYFINIIIWPGALNTNRHSPQGLEGKNDFDEAENRP